MARKFKLETFFLETTTNDKGWFNVAHGLEKFEPQTVPYSGHLSGHLAPERQLAHA